MHPFSEPFRTRPYLVKFAFVNPHKTNVPFHLRTPEDVLLVVHVDGEMLVFPLLHRVGACRYRTQLLKLEFASRTKHTETQTDTCVLFNPTTLLLSHSRYFRPWRWKCSSSRRKMIKIVKDGKHVHKISFFTLHYRILPEIEKLAFNFTVQVLIKKQIKYKHALKHMQAHTITNR